MISLRCYDNGGKTLDRYTVIPARWVRGMNRRTKYGIMWEGIDASDDPFHPLGFGQHIEASAGKHLGKLVPFESLPADVRQFAKQTFAD